MLSSNFLPGFLKEHRKGTPAFSRDFLGSQGSEVDSWCIGHQLVGGDLVGLPPD